MIVNNRKACYSFCINPSFTDCPIGMSPFTCWCIFFSLSFRSPIVSNVMHQLQDKESVFSTWLHGKQFFSLIASFLSLFPLSSFCLSRCLSLARAFAASPSLALHFCVEHLIVTCIFPLLILSFRLVIYEFDGGYLNGQDRTKLLQSQHPRQRFNLFYFRCSALLPLLLLSLSLSTFASVCARAPWSIPLG